MKKCILILSLLFVIEHTYSQTSDTEVKAALTYQFTKYIVWKNHSSIKEFNIGIYGNDTSMLAGLNKMARTVSSENSIKISTIGNIRNTKGVNILYVTYERNNVE